MQVWAEAAMVATVEELGMQQIERDQWMCGSCIKSQNYSRLRHTTPSPSHY